MRDGVIHILNTKQCHLLYTHSDLLFNAMVGDWEQKRPIWILYMLSSLTEENIRLRKIPLLDLFMDNAAEGLGKRVQAVETARDQCRPLNKLSNQQVSKFNTIKN